MYQHGEFQRWRRHPWHGLKSHPKPDKPNVVNAFIEITPFDTVKYEIDKETGYLMVDRPQRTTSVPPALYGFIPRTYCGPRVAALCSEAAEADGDPLDICIYSERNITKSEVLVRARVVGGIQMIDDGEADDKIIALVEGDNIWGDIDDLKDLPAIKIERLQHYFRTYKMVPGKNIDIKVDHVYGRDEALQVVAASIADYDEFYGHHHAKR